MASSALVGMPCVYPACALRADGAIIWVIHTMASMVNQTSHNTSSADATALGRIHRLPVFSQNFFTHLKPHSSALTEPCGMPASRAAVASTITLCSTSGLPGKSA